MQVKVYDNTGSAPVDNNELNVYLFNQDGQVTRYYEVGTGEEKDTTMNILFTYENGKLLSRKPAEGMPGSTYLYTYDGNTKTVTENENGIETTQIIWEYDDAANLARIIEYGYKSSFSITLFYYKEITEDDRKKEAEYYTNEMQAKGFFGLKLVQTKNGFPVKKMEIKEDGSLDDKMEITWNYDSKSRVIKRSDHTVGGGMAYKTYAYDEKGKLISAAETNGWKVEMSYSFY
jgi:hypothetical protein